MRISTITLLLSLPVLASCTVSSSGVGSTSDGRILAAKRYMNPNGSGTAGYTIEMSDGTSCDISVPTREFLDGKRVFPMTCSDGTKGEAQIAAVLQSGSALTINIVFKLNDGTVGQASIASGSVA